MYVYLYICICFSCLLFVSRILAIILALLLLREILEGHYGHLTLQLQVGEGSTVIMKHLQVLVLLISFLNSETKVPLSDSSSLLFLSL